MFQYVGAKVYLFSCYVIIILFCNFIGKWEISFDIVEFLSLFYLYSELTLFFYYKTVLWLHIRMSTFKDISLLCKFFLNCKPGLKNFKMYIMLLSMILIVNNSML